MLVAVFHILTVQRVFESRFIGLRQHHRYLFILAANTLKHSFLVVGQRNLGKWNRIVNRLVWM